MYIYIYIYTYIRVAEDVEARRLSSLPRLERIDIIIYC